MIVRTSIDPITGKLTDSRPKYLGGKPVRLVKMEVLGHPGILALSSRPWLFYSFGRRQMTSLLAFPFISVASSIKMSTYSHTVMAFSENQLRIVKLDNFGSLFHCDKLPLDYSGKRLMVMNKNLAVIESMQTLGNKGKIWLSKISIFGSEDEEIGKISEIAME